MSKDFPLPSLAQHFDPPEGYVGYFGWVVGFSAETEFMNNVIERFTRLTKHRRASEGRIALALFLDPHNPPISLADAPGVAHLPFVNLDQRPCRLVHAKVALLGFRGMDAGQQGKWCVRLLVSTGNWTQPTLEQSLDLAWAVDVRSDGLTPADEQTKIACADIKGANGLVQWLRDGANGLFDVRLLQATQRTKDEQAIVSGWVSECVNMARGIAPRFFDNRDKSMLVQLPELVKATGDVKRNYLALGSGFYEGEKASVPQKIIARLQEAGLLTNTPEIDIFVNPAACQSVATLHEAGVTVRPAAVPTWMQDKNKERALHAKFLFSAKGKPKDKKQNCGSAWVYLGSGNLTNPGFAQKMSASGGNLEAGIVFGEEDLLWYGDHKGEPAAKVITNLLPVGQDDKRLEALTLKAGESWEAEPPSHFAPPIPWLVWHETRSANELRFPEDASAIAPFVILDASGDEVQETSRVFPWSGEQPQQVRCRWDADGAAHEAYIPVVDGLGRIAAKKLQPLSIEDAWWQLADFPNPPDMDEPETEDDARKERISETPTATGGPSTASYPIRQMMELVEQIAAKQTEISFHDWPLWCRRLEQTLVQAKDSSVVSEFKTLGLNPIAPLRHAPFRPAYAEDASSDAGREYEDVLAKIETSWEVQKLSDLGSGNG